MEVTLLNGPEERAGTLLGVIGEPSGSAMKDSRPGVTGGDTREPWRGEVGERSDIRAPLSCFDAEMVLLGY